MIGIEVVKKQKTSKGKPELRPVVVNGKKEMMSKSQIQKLLKKNPKPKVKFQSNENSVDVVVENKEETVNESKKPKKEFDIKIFTDALSDIDIEYTDDSIGYRTFKSGKRVLCYAKNTRYGFSIAYRSDLAKSGWKSHRVTNKKEFEDEVEKFKKMVEQSELITSSLKPIFRCSYEECEHIAESKEGMIQHILNSH